MMVILHWIYIQSKVPGLSTPGVWGQITLATGHIMVC